MKDKTSSTIPTSVTYDLQPIEGKTMPEYECIICSQVNAVTPMYICFDCFKILRSMILSKINEKI
jgi:hypothetical protein